MASQPKEDIQPINWANQPKSYLMQTDKWDKFPNAKEVMIAGRVTVMFLKGGQLCQDDGINKIITITFLDTFGPLQPLVDEMHNMNNGAHVEIGTDDTTGMMTDGNGVDLFSVKGGKENNECSNCGICDYNVDSDTTMTTRTM
eukprot:15166734-Ditylum_brightwellii.AAC.1